MDRLKKIISKYNHWQEAIDPLVDRIEAEVDIDFGIAIGNAKAILETVSKHICTRKTGAVKENMSVQGLIKEAFKCLEYDFDSCKPVSTALATIAQEVGAIRNGIDISSHGKSLDRIQEIKEMNISSFTKELLLGSVSIVASFLIESFETRNVNAKKEPQSLEKYGDHQLLNDFIDGKYDEVVIGEDYTYLPSEVLFHLDKDVYREEYSLYLNSSIEESGS
ncbi:abortive infection family protein [Facilibium subflavum]|uniref:abortive infection family protein n=1 Tax=Facilibium subflavum TaxID=2219058 RepID=UPI000E65747D|nr:abortive infection family protein [Facilibium subflavum]